MKENVKLSAQADRREGMFVRFATGLDEAAFTADSYYRRLMSVNLDFMMGLDKDRLLYQYRRLAGLDTKGAESYGNWISFESGGAGQFEAHYVIALSKAAVSMPDYLYNGESVLDRLTYMVTELKKCYDAFAVKYPGEAGYLGAISTDHYTALEEGRLQASDGSKVWVPWYFQHKNIEMLLDVYNYAPDEGLRSAAYEMLVGNADWVYRRMSKIDDATREKVLRTEFGGMAEVLYQIYKLTKKSEHYRAAKFFEEKKFIDYIYAGTDLLTGLHANTTIPKILGCAAAYEATGDEYYRAVCEKAFEMIMTRTYANGSTSCWEHWQEPGKLSTSNESSETCCSYNMLKLSDYLYRWTGDKKYMDYYENVYTNHILASMAPDTGLKTYFVNSEFGFYKIYHTPDNSFWCCACTGMESFAKLPQGIYYAGENKVYVNMFYPSTYDKNGIKLEQSGDFFTEQKTAITVNAAGAFAVCLRVPDWAGDKSVSINGERVEATVKDGYIELERDWAVGDRIEYSLPFAFRLDTLKGHENKNALMYGPLLLVADLGDDNIDDVQESQLTFGVGYADKIYDKIVLDGTLDEAATAKVDNGALTVTLKTKNQGEIIFRPFNALFHSRYGMYFDFLDGVCIG